jgi:hypothetical protein
MALVASSHSHFHYRIPGKRHVQSQTFFQTNLGTKPLLTIRLPINFKSHTYPQLNILPHLQSRIRERDSRIPLPLLTTPRRTSQIPRPHHFANSPPANSSLRNGPQLPAPPAQRIHSHHHSKINDEIRMDTKYLHVRQAYSHRLPQHLHRFPQIRRYGRATEYARQFRGLEKRLCT